MKKYNYFKSFLLLCSIAIIVSCNIGTAPSNYNGKRLIKHRFTYWEPYKIYVDTGFVNPNRSCFDSNQLDSNYIVQSLYNDGFPTTERRIIYRNVGCVSDELIKLRSIPSKVIEVNYLAGQDGRLMAFRIGGEDSPLSRRIAICVGDYRYDPILDPPLCFTKGKLTLSLNMPKK